MTHRSRAHSVAFVLLVVGVLGRPTIARAACPDGGTPGPEICDGKDNDCDGLTDEDEHGDAGFVGICRAAQLCVLDPLGYECLSPCRGGDFPCFSDEACRSLPLSGAPDRTVSACVPFACARNPGACGPGTRCAHDTLTDFQCVPACEVEGCDGGKVCTGGTCTTPKVDVSTPRRDAAPLSHALHDSGLPAAEHPDSAAPASSDVEKHASAQSSSSCACGIGLGGGRAPTRALAAVVLAFLGFRRRRHQPG